MASMDEGMVEDAVGGKSVWAALKRGRLVHLEALGLAERHGRRFRLDGRLRRLQISRDIIWTINLRRLETGRMTETYREGRVTGKVARVGFHDGLGASSSVAVRDIHGVEHYARLAMSRGCRRPARRRCGAWAPTAWSSLWAERLAIKREWSCRRVTWWVSQSASTRSAESPLAGTNDCTAPRAEAGHSFRFSKASFGD